jgi:NTE family protein
MSDWFGSEQKVSLVLAGGAALGAYEAGAYAALHEHDLLRPTWLAGSSIGAVTAAIIAGNPPDRRIERLRAFWELTAADPFPIASFWMGRPVGGLLRQVYNDRSVLDALLFGRPGMFRPRLAPGRQVGVQDVPSLFDLAPLRQALKDLVDFDLLNDGDVRLSMSCTDVVSGERVVFDTGHGCRIEVDHVLASSAMMPVFAPIEIDGRLLADGCFGANTPLDLILNESADGNALCFVVELFARQGSRPHSLAAAASRATDLAFGNQTRRILEGRQREYHLKNLIGQLGEKLTPEMRDEAKVSAILSEGKVGQTTVVIIAYRAGLDEAGLLKPFDFSRATLTDRWANGESAMEGAIEKSMEPRAAGSALTVIEA